MPHRSHPEGDKGLTYAQGEGLLARTYKAPDRTRENAFRARLKHLKRLGIPLGSSPGRGAKIRYDFDQICQWALCLELAEAGMDPARVAELMKENWHSRISDLFQTAAEPGNAMYLAIHPNTMSKNWSSKPDEISFVYAEHAKNFFDRMRGPKRRTILINLSDLVQSLHISP